jgi:predicted Zn-dependent protease with MMP-like domain
MITPAQRRLFDQLLEQALADLPEHLRLLLDEVPLVVEDRASEALLREVDLDPAEDDLYGLHSGVALTERSVEDSGRLPDQIMLFREPLLELAGGSRSKLDHEIRVTLLHEIGHHFGLDEDDLDQLGYA